MNSLFSGLRKTWSGEETKPLGGKVNINIDIEDCWIEDTLRSFRHLCEATGEFLRNLAEVIGTSTIKVEVAPSTPKAIEAVQKAIMAIESVPPAFRPPAFRLGMRDD